MRRDSDRVVDFCFVVLVDVQNVWLDNLDSDSMTSIDDVADESFAESSSTDRATETNAIVTEDGIADLITRGFRTKQASDFGDFNSLELCQRW